MSLSDDDDGEDGREAIKNDNTDPVLLLCSA